MTEYICFNDIIYFSGTQNLNSEYIRSIERRNVKIIIRHALTKTLKLQERIHSLFEKTL